MQITVMYWNIWLDNQIQGKQAAEPFLQELTKIITKFQPDCIGLNEVLQHYQANTPFIFDHLQSLEYMYNHFAPASPFTNEWIIGAGLVSKFKLKSVKDIVLSQDIPAQKRGYKNETVKAIAAKIVLPENKHLRMIVVHPLYLRPYTKKVHFEATQKLKSMMSSDEFATNTILGGDFNESIHWPYSFSKAMRNKLNFRTGTILNPTWLHNANPWTPIRTNLDQLYWTKEGSVKLKSFRVINSGLSAHRPLLAVFEVS